MNHSSMYVGFVVSMLMMVVQTLSDNCTWTRYCLSDVTQNTIHNLMWKKTAVIHDDEHGVILQKLQQVELMVYKINNETVVRDVLQEIHAKLFPDVNVVVALESTKLIARVLFEADGFDVKSSHSTDWSHHSKWTVFSSISTVAQIGDIKLENLQNIALVTYEQRRCKGCAVDTFSSKLIDEGYRFSPVNERVSFPQKMFPNTQYRYNGRHLRVSVVESPPFVITNATGNKDGIPYVGYCMDVLHSIAEYLNLTLKYVEAENGIWGWVDDGMVGQLRRGEIDLIASEMTVHPTRVQYIDFITPFLQTEAVILFYEMPPATEPIFLLAGPFQISVYLTYLAVTLAVTTILILLETFTQFTFKLRKTRAVRLCLRVIKSSLKQGDSFENITVPARVLLAFWWLLVLLISSLYCGNLTASLATSSHLRKFQSIDELIESDFYVGVAGGTSMEQQLRNSTVRELKILYEKIRRINETDPKVTSISIASHIQSVKEGKYAFYMPFSNVGMLIKSNCSLSGLRINGMPEESTAFGIQKNSPFKDDINKVMQKLQSRGILNKMWETWTKKTETSACERGEKSITFTELIGGVIVASAGIGLASVSLFFEWIFVRFRKR